MSTAMATGTDSASSTMLSVVWPAASMLPLPGGRPGPSTKMTIGVRISVAISQSSARRRKCGVLSTVPNSHNLQEAVHVPDGLHRTTETVDVSSGAGHEALPAVEAPGASPERERDRLMRVLQRAWRVAALVLGVVVNPPQRDREVQLRHREDRVRQRAMHVAERASDDLVHVPDWRQGPLPLAVLRALRRWIHRRFRWSDADRRVHERLPEGCVSWVP